MPEIDSTTFHLFGLAGALILALAGVYALMRQKVVVDQKGNATSVKLPFFGELKTNYPSLAAIFLGCALGFFIVQKQDYDPALIVLDADASWEPPSDSPIFIGVIPSEFLVPATRTEEGLTARVPLPKDREYSVATLGVDSVLPDGTTIWAVVLGQPKELEGEEGLVWSAKLKSVRRSLEQEN